MEAAIRPRRPYWALLKKEIVQALPMFVIFVVVIAGWQGFLFTRIGSWPAELVFGLSFLPSGAVPFWLLWRGYSSLRQEWTGNHMHALLALPVPAWYFLSTKAIVIIVETSTYVWLTLGGGLLLASSVDMFAELAVAFTAIQWNIVGWLLVYSIFSPAFWIILTQFSYISGRLASRWQGVVSGVVFVLSMWFCFRLGGLLVPLLKWLPDLPVRGAAVLDGVPVETTVYVPSVQGVAVFLSAILLFWLGCYFIERDVEL